MSNYAAGVGRYSGPTPTHLPIDPPRTAPVCPEVKAETDFKISELLDYILPRNPVTHQRGIHLLPESVECAIGEWLYADMIQGQGGAYKNEEFSLAVWLIGDVIQQYSDRPLKYEFTVIDSSVLNAWCLPGGKIAICKGLIDAIYAEQSDFGLGKINDTDKIAAVLAHEIVHAAARHTAFTLEVGAFLFVVFKVVQFGLSIFISENEKKEEEEPSTELNLARCAHFILSHFGDLIRDLVMMYESRANEFEADRYSMLYLQRAGRNPAAAIWVQELLARQKPDRIGIDWLDAAVDLFRTHPHGEERIAACRQTLKDLKSKQLV